MTSPSHPNVVTKIKHFFTWDHLRTPPNTMLRSPPHLLKRNVKTGKNEIPMLRAPIQTLCSGAPVSLHNFSMEGGRGFRVVAIGNHPVSCVQFGQKCRKASDTHTGCLVVWEISSRKFPKLLENFEFSLFSSDTPRKFPR